MDLVMSSRGQSSYFNSYILQRIERNKNFLGAITGQTGSGKSYSALREGEVLDPDFDIRNVCFTAEEFMDLINGKTKQLNKGSVIVFDEIQVSMSHLDYQSIQAKILNYIFQTFRHKNFILFMTSPHFSFINASLRKLFHSRIETISIDPKNKIVTLKPMLIQVNQKSGDIYEKYLRVMIKGKGVLPIKHLKLGLASNDLIKAYEEKKDNFTKMLNESISKDLHKLKEKDNDKEKPLTDLQETVVKLLVSKKTIPEIAAQLNVEVPTVYQSIEAIKRKGIKIKPVKEQMRVLYYEIFGYKANC